MSTTTLNFSSSINIVRDNDYSFHYLPTPNSTEVYARLTRNVLSGQKSHIIIGAYGTGKSSLLLALQQTLKGFCTHFKNVDTKELQKKNYNFIPIVGDYTSIIDTFSELFGVAANSKPSEVIKAIDAAYDLNKKDRKGFAFIIDEFGKFLEYAAKNNPELELYFIQLLAEWVNDTKTDALLIATLHKDFSSYAVDVKKTQQQEWDKVKGRFKELLFNEPVEQLLFLAGEKLHKETKKIDEKSFKNLFKAIDQSKAFPLKDYFTIEIARKLFPLDILSASVLTLALQEYGQNERSLFSFLESADSFALLEHIKAQKGYYSFPQVYDYLINTFYSTLTTNKSNSHYDQWSSIRRTLERLEGIELKQPLADAQKMIKTIGLLQLFTRAGANLTEDFLDTYAKTALGIQQPKALLKELDGFMLIRYARYNNRYVIFEGTDVNITLAINNAGKIVERVSNVATYLNEHISLSIVSAKEYSYRTGTPRLFKFVLSEMPIVQSPEQEIDGFINLIFSSDEGIISKIQDASKQCNEAILYGYYQNIVEVQDAIFEIQKVDKAISNHRNDRTAVRLFEEIKAKYTTLLRYQIVDGLYSQNQNIRWFVKGDEKTISNRQAFNKILSQICDDVYPGTPIFKNELINKTKVSSQISSARKIVTGRLLAHVSEENIGFEANKFPPEKTIYLSLFRETAIHANCGSGWMLQAPTNESFSELWKAGESFLKTTVGKARKLEEFIDILLTRPFKLKQGFVDIWIALFLIAKTDEYALFDRNVYVPELNSDVLELINKRPEFFTIKAFDTAGIKVDLFNHYRTYLSLPEIKKPTNKLLIQTVKPFLTFYKKLNDYAKATKQLEAKTFSFREVIANAKDPENIMFNELPLAMGYSVQEMQEKPVLAGLYIDEIKAAVKELQRCYDELLNRFEAFIIKDIVKTPSSFPDYKEALTLRYKPLTVQTLPLQYRPFFTRLVAPIDDRASWLNALSQACIGKPLMSSKDEEEPLLHEKISEYIAALDSLTAISLTARTDNEDVMKVELTTSVEGAKTRMIRIFKSESELIDDKRKEIKTLLGDNQQFSLAVLITLLQEYLGNE